VLTQIKRLEKFINDWQMIPTTDALRNRVILPLLSKALTVGRAICALVKAGFPGEAFGLSRTLIDIFFAVRYISNKDTEMRATTFAEYAARVRKEFLDINNKYFPNRQMEASVLGEARETAEKFRSKHYWTGHGGQAKVMAMEPDEFEVDEDTGQPLTSEFDYDALYFWTSHFVHVTVKGLEGHAVVPGNVFNVRSGPWDEEGYAHMALFNTVSFLSKTFIQACRAMREDQPEKILNDLFKMMQWS
jgi:hypothetical protein